MNITLLNTDSEFELLFSDECLVDFSDEKRGIDECCEAVQFEVKFNYIECYYSEMDAEDEKKFRVPYA